jgi:hypothetical protein
MKAHVEVVNIDTWYCKHAASNWGDQRMPWPQADIDSCGIRMTPVQERFIRKGVQALGCLGNVIWLTDNEGGAIRGTQRAWYESVAAIIRDEEQKSGCGFVHMIGTNNPDVANGPFDYVATHQRAALLSPIAGRWTLNNERNPAFTPEQEASYFGQARERGLGWAFWRAGMDDADFERTLRLYQGIIGGGQTECLPSDSEDPKWQPGPVRGCQTLGALNAAKAEVGDRKALFPKDGTPEQQFAAMFQTLDLLAAAMRRQGLCAGRSRDGIFAKPANPADHIWEELHAVAATDGGYTGNPCKGSTWIYP